jgi:hypothetical protein
VLIETTIKPLSSLLDDCPGLVAIMKDRTDFRKAQVKNWYRIPIRSAPENLEACCWIAFYWSRFLEGATMDDLVQEFARQPGGIRARLRKLGLKLQGDTNSGEKPEALPATATQGSASSHWRQLRPNAGRPWTASDDEVLLRECEAATRLSDD